MSGEYRDDLPERAIAVVGMSGRFPGARDVAEYWDNLRNGVCALRDFDREAQLADGADPAQLDRPGYVAAKGFLDEADSFEAELFGFTRTEAAVLDPQHRLLLEAAWGALEDAGHNPLAVTPRTGVYVGGGTSEHMIAAMADPSVGADLGALNVRLLTDKDFLASWISYRLGLDGPALAVQTACSTSLTAVHLAVQALLLGECDLALAGGVAVDNVRREGYVHQAGGIMSADGRCRPFSAAADGTVRGNGVGVVALRRLEDAVADGDPIHAVIRGTAAANDGADKIGFTAPSVHGQTAAMTEALAAADVAPHTVGYIEMHGTATALGDRIEVAATAAAYGGAAPGSGAPGCIGGGIGIGSVKSNLGHLDAAAGVAGLIKAALMVRHGEFVPTVNVEAGAHPELGLEDTPLRLVTASSTWPTPASGEPRRAAVSSVGLGGSNVHVILEQPPASAGSATPTPAKAATRATTATPAKFVLPLSARTAEQAATLARNLAGALAAEAPDSPDLHAVSATLLHARARHNHRGFVVAGTHAEAAAELRALADRGVSAVAESSRQSGSALFVFPGQASQYPGMGAELYGQYPVFRNAMDRCARILTDSHGIDPRSWLDSVPEHIKLAGTRGATDYWQPAIVSVEYAAAELLRTWGVEPGAMVGHSIGEYTVAHLAGVLTLEDALRLVAERGRLMAKTAPGAMVAVRAAAHDVNPLLVDGAELAVVNGPDACVVAGAPDAVNSVVSALSDAGIEHRELAVDYAFHSALMDDILDEFQGIVAGTELSAPRVRYVSTVTGDWITAAQATSPAFWASQIRRPVRFADAVAKAGEATAGPGVEVGPGVGLTGHTKRTLGGRPVFPVLGRGDAEQISALTALGELWRHGADLRAPGTAGRRPAPRVHLPTYPFGGASFGALTLRPTPAAPITQSPTASPAQASTPSTASPAAPAAPAAPESTEEQIAELLRTTLGVTAPDDLEVSYLAAGGESLTAVHIVGRLREEFGMEVPITLLLEPIPLRTLAARITAEGAPAEDSLLASLLGELESESDSASASDDTAS